MEKYKNVSESLIFIFKVKIVYLKTREPQNMIYNL